MRLIRALALIILAALFFPPTLPRAQATGATGPDTGQAGVVCIIFIDTTAPFWENTKGTCPFLTNAESLRGAVSDFFRVAVNISRSQPFDAFDIILDSTTLFGNSASLSASNVDFSKGILNSTVIEDCLDGGGYGCLPGEGSGIVHVQVQGSHTTLADSQGLSSGNLFVVTYQPTDVSSLDRVLDFKEGCGSSSIRDLCVTISNGGNVLPEFGGSQEALNGINVEYAIGSPSPLNVSFSSAYTVLNPNRSLWVFGDGDTSRLDNPVHTYRRGGIYVARLLLYDHDITPMSDKSIDLTNAVRSFPSPVGVEKFGSSPPPPTLSIVPSPRCSIPSRPVSFTGTEMEHGLPPYNYAWNFGDGTTDNEANPHHSFASPGVYNVTLTVSDSYSRLKALGGPDNEWVASKLYPVGTGQGPVAAFDWKAPVRYWWDVNYDGTMNANPVGWRLDFDAGESCFPGLVPNGQGGSVLMADSPQKYRWTIDDSKGDRIYTSPSSTDSNFHFDSFPALGVYNVTLVVDMCGDTPSLICDSARQLGIATTASHRQEVWVRDILIVSIGDSFASGEGNPHVEQKFNAPCLEGLCDANADFALSASDAIICLLGLAACALDLAYAAANGPYVKAGPIWEDKRCHRSQFAADSLAAMALEEQDPRSSVTFLHLACSGSTIGVGVTGAYEGTEGGSPDLPPQVIQAADSLCPAGSHPLGPLDKFPVQATVGLSCESDTTGHSVGPMRPIDYLLVHAGVNDIGFEKIIRDCAGLSTLEPLNPPCTEYSNVKAAPSKILNLDSGYAALNKNITNNLPINPSHVLISEYPEPFHNSDGSYCNSNNLDNMGTFTSDESAYLSRNIAPALNTAIFAAALKYGWTYVGGIAAGFAAGHGFCSSDHWIIGVKEAILAQGPCGSWCWILDNSKNSGIFHPNHAGHEWVALQILQAINNPNPPLDVEPFSWKTGNAWSLASNSRFPDWLLGTVYGERGAADCLQAFQKPGYCSNGVEGVIAIPKGPVTFGLAIDGVLQDCTITGASNPDTRRSNNGATCFEFTDNCSPSPACERLQLWRFAIGDSTNVLRGDGEHRFQIVPNPNPIGQTVIDIILKTDFHDPIPLVDISAGPYCPSSGCVGVEGWYRSPVSIKIDGIDGYISCTGSNTCIHQETGSGLQALTYNLDNGATVHAGPEDLPQVVNVFTEGIHTLNTQEYDYAGRASDPTLFQVKIDLTPPTLTGGPTKEPNTYGWYNTDVIVHFDLYDGLSGLYGFNVFCDVVCGQAANGNSTQMLPSTIANSQDFVTATEGVGGMFAQAFDKAGNGVKWPLGLPELTLRIDKTPPTITSPQENQNYILRQTVPVSVSCTDSLSGIPVTLTHPSPCSIKTEGKMDPYPCGSILDVGPTLCLDTSAIGPHSYTVSAIDRAGNIWRTTVHYNVIYQFKWISPSSGASVPANSMVNVGFMLTDVFGTPVNATKPPKIWVDCPPQVPLSQTPICGPPKPATNCVLHFGTACSNMATFKPGTGEFKYRLSTFGLPPGGYFIWVTLDDGRAYSTQITIIGSR